MTSSIIIRTDLLVAVSRWASADNMRPQLHVVLFKGNEMVACDGHRLVRVPVSCNGLTIAIDRDLIAAAANAQALCRDSAPRDGESGGCTIEITKNGKEAVLNLGRFVLRGPIDDPSSYPPIDSVMPKERPDRSPDGYGFDPKYLAAIHDVEVAAGATAGCQIVKVTGWSADGLGGMLFEGHRGIRYVIMPGRVR